MTIASRNESQQVTCRIDRRTFGIAAAAGVAGAITSSGEAALGGERVNPAAPHVGPSRFQFSLAAYSYRSLLQGDPPRLTMFDFVDDCVRFGLQGTELTSYYFPDRVSDDYLRDLKRHCFRQGINISGTAIRCDFGVPAGAARDQEIRDVKAWIDRAHVLGAPVIRIFAGHKPEGQSARQTHELIVSGISECCEYAGDRGVHLALENHGGPTATADGLLAIVRDIDSPWFGVNLDTGNFRVDNVYDQLEAAAAHAINVQVKVVTSDSNGQKSPADFARIADILRAANYRGYVVLEFEEEGDPRRECPRYLGELRKAFGGAGVIG